MDGVRCRFWNPSSIVVDTLSLCVELRTGSPRFLFTNSTGTEALQTVICTGLPLPHRVCHRCLGPLRQGAFYQVFGFRGFTGLAIRDRNVCLPAVQPQPRLRAEKDTARAFRDEKVKQRLVPSVGEDLSISALYGFRCLHHIRNYYEAKGLPGWSTTMERFVQEQQNRGGLLVWLI